MSPFVAFNNNPIFFVYPLGLESGGPGDGKTEETAESVSTVKQGRDKLEKKTSAGDFTDHYFKTSSAKYKAVYKNGSWEVYQKRNGKYVSTGTKYTPKSSPPQSKTKASTNTEKTASPSSISSDSQSGSTISNSSSKETPINTGTNIPIKKKNGVNIYPEKAISFKDYSFTYHPIEGIKSTINRYGITASGRIHNTSSTFKGGFIYNLTLSVSMHGYSTIQQNYAADEFEWIVTVSIYADGTLFDKKLLKPTGFGAFVPPNQSDIGSALFKLPTNAKNVKIVLEYGYTFWVSGGVGFTSSGKTALLPFETMVPIEPKPTSSSNELKYPKIK
jgi:hypothetical protein